MVQRSARILIAAALAATSFAAAAAVTSYSSRTTFEDLGSFSYKYGFDDLDTSLAATGGTGLLYAGDPWTTHGVTYNTGSNLVVGPSLGLGLTSNVFTSNSSSPGGLVSGTIGGSYNLFGFDLGTLLGSSNANISVMTNLNTYNFSGMGALREPSTSFFGILAGSGEYFTSFVISDVTAGTVPALDNVTLGLATSPVPEPGILAMLLPGLLLLGLASGRRACPAAQVLGGN